MSIFRSFLLIVCCVAATGCATERQNNTAAGAGVGAVAGGIIGAATGGEDGALLGATAGAIVGGAVGNAQPANDY